MTPWAQLAQLITAELAESSLEANVYAVPPEAPAPPAIAIRPADPWIESASAEQPFSRLRESYEAAVIVLGADVPSAVDQLYQLAHAVERAAVGRYAWVRTSGIAERRALELIYLGVTVTLTYSAEG